jgi:hypothetical protein
MGEGYNTSTDEVFDIVVADRLAKKDFHDNPIEFDR